MLQVENVYYDDLFPNWYISRRETTVLMIVFVTQGQFVYELNDTAVQLQEGDVLLIPPGTYRMGTNGPFPPHRKYSIHLTVPASEQAMLLETMGNVPYALFRTRNGTYLRQRFRQLFHIWRGKTSHTFMYTGSGIALELVGMTLQELQEQTQSYHKLDMAKKIEAYITTHYREEIKVETLAQLVNRTPNYVSAIFKEVTGQTIIEYIHRYRIATARDMLLYSEMNVADISHFLGFCDPSYFNRVFKKITGRAPSSLLKERTAEKPLYSVSFTKR